MPSMHRSQSLRILVWSGPLKNARPFFRIFAGMKWSFMSSNRFTASMMLDGVWASKIGPFHLQLPSQALRLCRRLWQACRRLEASTGTMPKSSSAAKTKALARYSSNLEAPSKGWYPNNSKRLPAALDLTLSKSGPSPMMCKRLSRHLKRKNFCYRGRSSCMAPCVRLLGKNPPFVRICLKESPSTGGYMTVASLAVCLPNSSGDEAGISEEMIGSVGLVLKSPSEAVWSSLFASHPFMPRS